MGPVSAFVSFFARYFDVYGRSRRSEFGWMIIIQIMAYILIAVIVIAIGGGPDAMDPDRFSSAEIAAAGTLTLIWLGTLIPWLTLSIRRFHDMGQSGWLVLLFMLLMFIPLIGLIAGLFQFIWLLFGGGTAGANKYGQDPRYSPGLDFL